MSLHVNQGGVWKSATPYVKDGGVWKAVQEFYVKDAGVWKLVFTAGPTFDPTPGSYTAQGTTGASWSVGCSQSTTWTYTKASSITASRASGTAGTSINFSIQEAANGAGKQGTVNLSTVINGTTYSWTIQLIADGSL